MSKTLFYREMERSIEEVDALLRLLPDENKDSFSRDVALRVMKEYEDKR